MERSEKTGSHACTHSGVAARCCALGAFERFERGARTPTCRGYVMEPRSDAHCAVQFRSRATPRVVAPFADDRAERHCITQLAVRARVPENVHCTRACKAPGCATPDHCIIRREGKGGFAGGKFVLFERRSERSRRGRVVCANCAMRGRRDPKGKAGSSNSPCCHCSIN